MPVISPNRDIKKVHKYMSLLLRQEAWEKHMNMKYSSIYDIWSPELGCDHLGEKM